MAAHTVIGRGVDNRGGTEPVSGLGTDGREHTSSSLLSLSFEEKEEEEEEEKEGGNEVVVEVVGVFFVSLKRL